VNTWSGIYFGGDKGPPGGYLVMLRDTTHDGRADVVTRFGAKADSGGHGGTGIGLHGSALYAEENGTIVRYTLPASGRVPTDPVTVVRGLPLNGDHPMHPFAIDSAGMMYVDLGSASNACQLVNRVPNSPGHNPCTELRTRGGIWAYDVSKTNQTFSPANRFATGIRNSGGVLPRALGPGRTAVLHRQPVPREVSERRVHRLPRIVESRTRSPGGISGRLPAAVVRQSLGLVRVVRERLRRGRDAARCGQT